MATPGTFKPRAIALAGPTASGKTAAALAIAREHGAEIISVDSALVYRGMDIGTAKPSAEELAQAAHHLIDIRDPLHAYSAAEFATDAKALIADINARGRLALLVGGTMLYFKALFEGLDAMPRADADVRARIESQASVHGWPAMHVELAKVDPVTAARLGTNDAQRIQRALEVFHVAGRPISSFHAMNEKANKGVSGIPLISLEPADRAWLHERIAQRFDAMLAQGFLKEVKTLRSRRDLHANLPSMRCVGYRQAWALLDAFEAGEGDAAFPTAQLREKGIFATRQLAKRQLTWLRGMTRHVIAADAPDALDQVLHAVRKAL